MNDKTIIYEGTEKGDWVICSNCGKKMLLPYGADQCPECTCEGSLQWVDETMQEADAQSVGETEYKDRKLELQDYLCCDTLAVEYPDEYQKLQRENNLNEVESPEADVKAYAKQYGYAALGYALVQMVNNGDFNPDWDFAQRLWEWDGVACKCGAQEESVDD